MKRIILLIVLTLILNSYSKKTEIIQDRNVCIPVKKDYTIRFNIDNRIETRTNMFDTISKYEGIVLQRYKCPSGQETIGVGHMIKENETIPNTISMQEAEDLFNKDFAYCKGIVESISNRLENQYNAIAWFIFAVGEGNYNKSNIKKCFEDNTNIDSTIILKYAKYKKNGVYVFSNNLKRTMLAIKRMYEYN